MASKRKAEDEVNATNSDQMGATAEPAVKKVKVETDRESAPASAASAALDEGTAGTGTDTHKATAPDQSNAVPDTDMSAAEPAAIKQETVSIGNGVKPDTGSDVVAAAGAESGAALAATGADAAQKLGYRTFNSGDEAFQYFHDLMHNLRHNQDLNEYEANAVLDLIRKGHPHPQSKIGAGVRAVQVREHEDKESICFHILRVDSSMEDFSMRKCVAKLFPKWGANNQRKLPDAMPRRGGFGARGRGGGRGFRGRGGDRGRGRGGARGRGRGCGRD